MSRRTNEDPSEMMMAVTLEGFKQAKAAMDAIKGNQTNQARATYSALTSSGKSRYVASLAETSGSQAEVAELLNLTPGRISQLVKSEKNRKNGK